MPSRLLSLWPGLVAAGQILVICGVLLGSLSYQFVVGELPCPLCMIQRLSFLLACVGPLGILRKLGQPGGGIAFQTKGFALCILASTLGIIVSCRQILLHIVPPDPGYGPPVLGLHLYTWALLVFFCLILSSALGILGANEKAIALPRLLTQGIVGLILLIAAVIVLALFAMQGFHWLLPDSPKEYLLFHPASQLGD